MDNNKIQAWSDAVDQAEGSLISAGLPKPEDVPAGLIIEDNGRRWVRVNIVSGRAGSRWAYWHWWKTDIGQRGIGPHPEFHAVADYIFNGDAVHFIGMLPVPFQGLEPGRATSGVAAWVMTDPKPEKSNEPRVYEEKQPVRYERSREIYDVESGKVTPL